MSQATLPQAPLAQPTFDDAPAPAGQGWCPQCGAPLDRGDKFCVACGTPQETPAPAAAAPEQKRLRCESCGAQIAVDPGQRSYTCPFCESTYVVEFTPQESARQRPEFVIGFAIAPEQAQEAFRRWIASGGWFRPSDLRHAQVVDRLRGVYLPFWAFTMLAHSRWSASIGEYWWRTETYTTVENGKTVTRTRQVRETEWWPLAGRHHEYHSGYLVSGSRGLVQQEAEAVKPFHLAALKRYEPFYLAGWLSEEYSVQREAALELCKQEFARRERGLVAAFMPGDTHSNLECATEFSQINSDLVLLPVYLLTYRYGGKPFRFLLNGQTGRCAGRRPISWWRVGLAIGGGLLLVGLVALVIAIVAALAQ
jgi:hypothetical protein